MVKMELMVLTVKMAQMAQMVLTEKMVPMVNLPIKFGLIMDILVLRLTSLPD
jgi:hypothetical protein